MVKPEKCTFCSGEEFTFIKDNVIFNPDTDEDETIDSYVCDTCKAIHVNNNEYSFAQKELESDKLIQTTDTNITIN